MALSTKTTLVSRKKYSKNLQPVSLLAAWGNRMKWHHWHSTFAADKRLLSQDAIIPSMEDLPD
jgi:hypothetical protein